MSAFVGRSIHSRLEQAVPVLAIAAIGALYLATMYPGVHATGDAAKFSFVGPVLGTPHEPGYPLYMVLSYLFSHVPVGTMAFRMNLFSVCWALVALVFVYRLALAISGSKAAAVFAVLALGTGDAFWSRALYAKGYTLNAALVAAGAWCLIRWDQTRTPRWFWAAAAVFSLSLGNHLTVLAVLPAVVAFALVLEWRWVLRPPRILGVCALVGAGLAQYLYIIVRTLKPAPYLEARATTLPELWDVMTARRFAHEIGAFDWHTLVAGRFADIVGLLHTEFDWLGWLALAVGLACLLRIRPAHAWLLVGGAIGVVVLTVNMGSEEDQGFLLPAFTLAWPVAAVALAALARWVPARTAVAATILAVIVVPLTALGRNFDRNDHRRDTGLIEFLDALFEQLPDQTILVEDEYRVRQMLLYKLLGERAAGDRRISIARVSTGVAEAIADGRFVVAVGTAIGPLERMGFTTEPMLRSRATAKDGFTLEARRVVRVGACADGGNLGWLALDPRVYPKGRLSVRIDNFGPFTSEVSFLIAAAGPVEPWVTQTGGAGELRYASSTVESTVLLKELERAGVTPVDRAVVGTRLDVFMNDKGAHQEAAIDLGPAATSVLWNATVDRPTPARARACSHPLAYGKALGADSWVGLMDSADLQFTEGWHELERRSDGLMYRWTGARAVLIVTGEVAVDRIVRVVVEPFRREGRGPQQIRLSVNGDAVEPADLPAGRTTVSFRVPARSWRDGLNLLVFDVPGAVSPASVGASADQRVLGASVTRLEIGPFVEGDIRSLR